MKTWRALSLVVFAVTLPLAACAGRTAPAVSEQQPTHPAWLAGTWEGDAFQVSASKDQGDAHIVITFASDGSWKATSPTGTWSGTSSLVGDRLVLEGVAPDAGKFNTPLRSATVPEVVSCGAWRRRRLAPPCSASSGFASDPGAPLAAVYEQTAPTDRRATHRHSVTRRLLTASTSARVADRARRFAARFSVQGRVRPRRRSGSGSPHIRGNPRSPGPPGRSS